MLDLRLTLTTSSPCRPVSAGLISLGAATLLLLACGGLAGCADDGASPGEETSDVTGPGFATGDGATAEPGTEPGTQPEPEPGAGPGTQPEPEPEEEPEPEPEPEPEAVESPCKDGDKDGFFAPAVDCPQGIDCDDNDTSVHPGGAEVCGDGKDNDCQGGDEACCTVDCTGKQCGDDGCGGECGGCAAGAECKDGTCELPTASGGSCAGTCGVFDPQAACKCDKLCASFGNCCEDICDACSADLPSLCTCEDVDQDGFGEGPTCGGPDCNDADAAVNPGAAEICGDGIDNDCKDGDEACPVEECTEALDTDGDTFCAPEDCKEGDATVFPGAVEICGDGIDNDCKDGDKTCPALDCLDVDGDGYGEGTQCASAGVDCNDQDPNVNPGAPTDACGDGVDQDCDGVDPACPSACVDNDADGAHAIASDCPDGTDCDDNNATVKPGAEELCGDGLDNDCAGGDEACVAPGGCASDSDCEAGYLCNSTVSGGECQIIKYWHWWAPTLYVDTPSADEKLGWDVPTRFDFDGNLVAGDNADHVDTHAKPLHTYYSYVRTESHAFIGYHLFWPRRWSSAIAFGTEYENAMQSILLVVRIDTPGPDGYGELELMLTSSESTYWRYRPTETDLVGWDDGDITWDTSTGHARPVVFAESENHGLYGAKGWEEGFPGEDGFIARWGFEADVPDAGVGEYGYSLLALVDTLWPLKEDIGDTKAFQTFGVFAGDDANDAESVAPWSKLDDALGGSWPAGELLFDPASLVRRQYTDGWGTFPTSYTYNPYALRVEIHDLGIWTDSEAFPGDDADPYIELYLRDGLGQEKKMLGKGDGYQNHWTKDNVETGTILNMKEELGRYWFYGLEYPGAAYMGIEIREADAGFDDWLMDPAERSYQSYEGLKLLNWVDSDAFVQIDLP